jgi:hypothetical protein
MAATTKGTAHLFGTDGVVITNATVTEINLEPAFELNQTTPDENGVIIETRRDSISYKGSISLFMRASYTIPALGNTIALNIPNANTLTRNYEVVSTPVVLRAGEKISVTLNLESHPGTNI